MYCDDTSQLEAGSFDRVVENKIRHVCVFEVTFAYNLLHFDK